MKLLLISCKTIDRYFYYFLRYRFSEFRVPKLYIGNQAVLSLFADGKTTGTVLDVGAGITHTVPIYEGYAIPFATTEIKICGQDLTQFMNKMLNEN